MATMTVSVEEEVANEFRQAVEEDKGGKKGDLGKAITEAMKKWLADRSDEKIAQRQLAILKVGQYKLSKGWKFRREEAYER